jgi:hypothetical protein
VSPGRGIVEWMRTFLIVVASVIPIIGAVPYFIDSLKQKTHPKFATWSTWALLNAINAAAAYADGALPTAVASTAGTIATGAIAAVALKNGFSQYARFDALCQGLALFGIVLWLFSSEPAAAVVMILIVDLFAGLPTLRHAWTSPFAETPAAFLTGAIGSLIILASLEQFTFVGVALPLWILLFDVLVVAIIFIRRRAPDIDITAKGRLKKDS